jgi:hypothetical protein
MRTHLQKHSLSLRERARVRGKRLIFKTLLPPQPAFGHLLPHGEGKFLISVLIRCIDGEF